MQGASGTIAESSRPDPGLARGVWEAPRWVFSVTLALVTFTALGWAARAATARMGRRKRGR